MSSPITSSRDALAVMQTYLASDALMETEIAQLMSQMSFLIRMSAMDDSSSLSLPSPNLLDYPAEELELLVHKHFKKPGTARCDFQPGETWVCLSTPSLCLKKKREPGLRWGLAVFNILSLCQKMLWEETPPREICVTILIMRTPLLQLHPWLISFSLFKFISNDL